MLSAISKLVLLWVLLLPGISFAAPTRFESSNYGVESVFLGLGVVLHDSSYSVPPVIVSGPTVSAITTSSFTVTWKTDIVTNQILEYGLVSGTYTDQVGVYTDYSSVDHQVQVRNLQRGATYYYRVRSQDVAGNSVQSAEKTISTDPGDIIAPIITVGPVITNDSATTATVYWETSEVASSLVEYGVGDVTQQSVGRPDELTLQHQVQLVGLTPLQKYLIRAKTKDAAGNVTVSDTQEITRPAAPGVSGVRISNVTLTTALVEWETSLSTTSLLAYGTSQALGQNLQDTEAYTQRHIRQLTDLESGTTYYLQLSGKDASGNLVTSDVYAFKTVTQPLITEFQVSQVDQAGATLTWKSSSELDELVRTEITDSFDKSLIGKQATVGTEKVSVDHTAQLTDLESDTEYCAVARGKDAFGNSAQSNRVCFRTQKDTIPPVVSSVKIITNLNSGSKGVQVLVSFATSKPTSAVVPYAEGTSGPFTETASADGEEGLSRSHFVVMSGLNTGSTYVFKIQVRDRAGNTNQDDQEYLVPTDAPRVTVFQLIADRLISGFGWLGNVRK